MRTMLVAFAASGCVTSLRPMERATLSDAAVAPAFSLTAQDKTTVSLSDGLSHGAVVLVFYRGYW